jgi:hypothetical protein
MCSQLPWDNFYSEFTDLSIEGSNREMHESAGRASHTRVLQVVDIPRTVARATCLRTGSDRFSGDGNSMHCTSTVDGTSGVAT